MSGYITTNIRLPEVDYLRLKNEAAKNRKSLAAVIREKIKGEDDLHSEREAKRLMADIRKIAQKNAKYTKGFDSVKALREIRYNKA